jgi:hypothetical protein
MAFRLRQEWPLNPWTMLYGTSICECLADHHARPLFQPPQINTQVLAKQYSNVI